MVHVLFSLMDAEPDAPAPTAAEEAAPPARVQPQGRLLGPFSRRLRARRRRVHRLLRKGVGIVAHPSRLSTATQRGKSIAATVAKLALAGPDPETALKGELGVTKRAAWSAAIPLEDVKTIRRWLGGSTASKSRKI